MSKFRFLVCSFPDCLITCPMDLCFSNDLHLPCVFHLYSCLCQISFATIIFAVCSCSSLSYFSLYFDLLHMGPSHCVLFFTIHQAMSNINHVIIVKFVQTRDQYSKHNNIKITDWACLDSLSVSVGVGQSGCFQLKHRNSRNKRQVTRQTGFLTDFFFFFFFLMWLN